MGEKHSPQGDFLDPASIGGAGLKPDRPALGNDVGDTLRLARSSRRAPRGRVRRKLPDVAQQIRRGNGAFSMLERGRRLSGLSASTDSYGNGGEEECGREDSHDGDPF